MKIGIVLIIGSIITWLIDIFSPLIVSKFLGEVFCGDDYLEPIDGVEQTKKLLKLVAHLLTWCFHE